MHCINDIYKIKRSICQSNTNNKYTSTYRIHKSFILNNDNRQVRIYSHRYVTKNQRRKIKDIFVSALSSLPTDRGENQEGKINIKEAISKYCTTITVRGRFCRTGEERRAGGGFSLSRPCSVLSSIFCSTIQVLSIGYP